MSTAALPFDLPAGQLGELRSAYACPPRDYHDFAHVEAVLCHYAEVASGPGWQQPVEAALAVLYHDAVYEAGRGDNEARSAQLAAVAIPRWQPAMDVDLGRVAALIELTARHGRLTPGEPGDGPAGEDARLFLDCDMAILGAEPARFEAYDRGIAAEFSGHVPGWLFRLRRRRFLQSLLSRERIFLSGFFHERLDAAARANLRRRLSRGR